MPEIAQPVHTLVVERTGDTELADLVHKAITQAYQVGANRGLEDAATAVAACDPVDWPFGAIQDEVVETIRLLKKAIDPPPPDGVRVQPTTYWVSAVPETHPDASHFTVAVEYRGHGLWAVTRHAECLSRSGEWEYETRPSERTPEWCEQHRFPYPEAIRRAREIAPHLTVMGRTVADVLAEEAPDET